MHKKTQLNHLFFLKNKYYQNSQILQKKTYQNSKNSSFLVFETKLILQNKKNPQNYPRNFILFSYRIKINNPAELNKIKYKFTIMIKT